MSRTFFGKYRGSVKSNVDPMGLGRLQVSVPAVLGDGQMCWATPCVPYAGNQVGLFLIPPTGANIWVEFEAGDPNFPIWAGCFWGTGEVPASPATADQKVLKLENGFTLSIVDGPSGTVSLEVGGQMVSTPLTIKLGSSGIELTNGSMKIAIATSSVSINDGALEVI